MTKLKLSRETVLNLTAEDSQQVMGGMIKTVTCNLCNSIYSNCKCVTTTATTGTTTIIIVE